MIWMNNNIAKYDAIQYSLTPQLALTTLMIIMKMKCTVKGGTMNFMCMGISSGFSTNFCKIETGVKVR